MSIKTEFVYEYDAKWYFKHEGTSPVGRGEVQNKCMIDRRTDNLDLRTKCCEIDQFENVMFRKTLSADGVYVKGKLNGVEVYYTADTGATKTVVSENFYMKMPSDKRPELRKKQASITGASGKPIHLLGIGKFEMDIGSLCIKK